MGSICIFGDSITAGAGDSEQSGWAFRFKNWADRNNVQKPVYILGINGDTTSSLLKRIGTECAVRDPETIIIAIGTNDARMRGIPHVPETDEICFQDNLADIVSIAGVYTHQILFVGLLRHDESATLPLSGNTDKYYFADRTKKYDGLLQELCGRYNAVHVPVFDRPNDLDFPDGIHPGPAGHAYIFINVKERYCHCFFHKEVCYETR